MFLFVTPGWFKRQGRAKTLGKPPRELMKKAKHILQGPKVAYVSAHLTMYF